MAYGDNTQAFKLIKCSMCEIKGAAQTVRRERTRSDEFVELVTFSDKSFIEIDKWSNRQAFLASGWNITPRD